MVPEGLRYILEAASLLYLFCALALAAYALHAYGILAVLVRYFSRSRDASQKLQQDGITALQRAARWPDVVTQLPIYNEANVVERLIRAVVAMEYPGRHTVQVLDDSSDETCALIDAVAEDLRSAGHRIMVIRRPDRRGFKAGAPAFGMEQCDADYFAVFEADFVPPRDFLFARCPFSLATRRLGSSEAAGVF